MLARTFLILLLVLCWRVSCLAQYSGSSLVEIKAAAEAGDPAAQDKYAEKFILRADIKQAELWYHKAAEQGYAHAQGKLGNLLLSRSRPGYHNPPPELVALRDDAVKWSTLAANQGDSRGQADLADIYYQ